MAFGNESSILVDFITIVNNLFMSVTQKRHNNQMLL